MERKLDPGSREALRSLMQHPGWKILVEEVIPQRVRVIERRLARHEYEVMGQVWADQAVVRALETLPSIIEIAAQEP